MSTLPFQKSISCIRNGDATPKMLQCFSKEFFFAQLELTEYPPSEKQEKVIALLIGLNDNFYSSWLNRQKDIRWLEKSAKQGCVDAMVLLGQYYYVRPKGESIEALKALLEVNQFTLSEMGEKQLERKYRESAKWFKKGYDQGSVLAIYYLVKLLKNGIISSPSANELSEKIDELRVSGGLSKDNSHLDLVHVLLLENAVRLEALERAKYEVENEKSQVDKLLKQREMLIRDNAHSVKHTIDPQMISHVIKSIRSDNKRKGDVLMLHRASQAEQKVLEMNTLMEVRLQGEEHLRKAVSNSISQHVEGCLHVHDIIDYVFSRMLDEALNPYLFNLKMFRDEIVRRTGQTVDALRQSFDDAIVANYNLEEPSKLISWKWFDDVVCDLALDTHPVWDSIHIKYGSVFETLLFKWINELILNALKYHAPDSSPMISINLSEVTVSSIAFLSISVSNTIQPNKPTSESQIGLQLMKKELDKLNDYSNSLRLNESREIFSATLLLKKSFLDHSIN